ncbi:DEAD/DEAH box helicase [Streptomyces europaeiscabiei]|uniref:DEAD/DEAH box helicase n=1 Tax=Streptomyces europaeiscabiei TaxID=146819 RepID=A0ABU4NPF7_9ACTN|nr:DEAD/DEAH box helicase [Streptomyces europaeiscabiei]MDX3547195.1 DEAD/DEAH box helicase [Streptomyces europaeiscabiei]MDX3556884.1 DEAD/DEAH box helicase [Streptomyces europaeiscabiei]MDX3704604.1 DEAD/DEAH box helicase [Streptomyces europaeiscabiei]
MNEPTPQGPTDRLHPVVLHHIVNSLGWPGLRALQQAAITPLMDGADALLLAPTAGGKTEAALFPLLSKMGENRWPGTSVLYVCPLKALLNNLLPRLESYTSWLGRTAALWHGDVSQTRRRTILRNRPDILLTTPESLESMLVSAHVDHHAFFSGLRAIVVDEIHAFAGDDRGWHLLAVLERLERVAGRPVQRIGLSATVGNPEELLKWLQGAHADTRTAQVVAPRAPRPNTTTEHRAEDIQLDYVGSLDNAAKVIASLHQGEKRLVFCESRRQVEHLGEKLRAKGVTTFLSHASLSADERRRAEEAFAEARDCVIIATSTLELGIDVGDLDRVIQIDAPSTVAAFLQRLGRTGRRPGSTRNCLFLTLDEEGLLAAAGLLLQWSRGWVEPVEPPPEPRHIVAQQVLALCLQERQVGEKLWQEWWGDFGPFGPQAEPLVRHLLDQGFLDRDNGMLFIGTEAEQRFGFRHFMDLTAVFTAAPEFTVLYGRNEIGTTDPALLTERVHGPRLLLLAGRSWKVTYIDWSRRRCFVEPVDGGGKARWGGTGFLRGSSFSLTRAVREVLLDADPAVTTTRRATEALGKAREAYEERIHPGGTVVLRGGRDTNVRWWTWAGQRANATLAATLDTVADPLQRPTDAYIRLREDVTAPELRKAREEAAGHSSSPAVDPRALCGLKFAVALPEELATATLAARLTDPEGAAAVLAEPVRWTAGLTER